MTITRRLLRSALTVASLLGLLSASAMAGGHRRQDVVIVAPAPVVVAASPVVQSVYLVESAPTYVVRQRPVYVEAPLVISPVREVVRLAPVTPVVRLEPVESVYVVPTTVVVPTATVLPAPRYVVQPARGRIVIPRQVFRAGY